MVYVIQIPVFLVVIFLFDIQTSVAFETPSDKLSVFVFDLIMFYNPYLLPFVEIKSKGGEVQLFLISDVNVILSRNKSIMDNPI